MTAIRFQIYNADGVPQIEEPGGAASMPEHTSAEHDARRIMADLANSTDGVPAGWQIRLWKDVILLGPISGLGDPDVELVAPCDPPRSEHWEHMASCVLRELNGGPLSRWDLHMRLSSPSGWSWFEDLLDGMEAAGRLRPVGDLVEAAL